MTAIEIGGGMILLAGLTMAWALHVGSKALEARGLAELAQQQAEDAHARLGERMAEVEAVHINVMIDLRVAARLAGYALHKRRAA